jgi:hypothetical protein
MASTDSQKLAHIQSTVASLQNRLNREVLITSLLGLVTIVAICGYFYYGYTQINELLQPKTLVNYAGTMAQDKLPELRQQLEAEVEKNAPVWAEELSRQAVSSMPQVREQLEEHIISQVDAMFTQTVTLTEPEMKKFMEEHKTEIARAISELKQDDKVLSDESMAEIEKSVSDALGTDMKEQAHEALRTLQEMIAKGTQLRDGQNLNEFDTRLRAVIMILRRFHLRERAGEAPLALPGG